MEAGKAEALTKSQTWINQGAELTNGLHLPGGDRGRVSVTLHGLCLEHHRAIHVLVSSDLLGSAFALLRPQMEAYIRASWYYYCATDEDLASFLQEDKNPPKVDDLVRDLEADAMKKGDVSNMKASLWRASCGFTHGGAIQVKARSTEKVVSPNYHPFHVCELLKGAATLGLLSHISLADMTGSELLVRRLVKGFTSTWGTVAELVAASSRTTPTSPQ